MQPLAMLVNATTYQCSKDEQVIEELRVTLETILTLSIVYLSVAKLIDDVIPFHVLQEERCIYKSKGKHKHPVTALLKLLLHDLLCINY